LRALWAQRIDHITSGYAEAHDAHHLRHDPRCNLGLERRPLEAQDDLASAPTFARLEQQVDRPDLYRLTRALVDHCIASSPAPPAAMVLDIDHSDDPTPGQQEFTCSTNHYQTYG
jgi:hypothetical protein